jgi:hypothetical protein
MLLSRPGKSFEVGDGLRSAMVGRRLARIELLLFACGDRVGESGVLGKESSWIDLGADCLAGLAVRELGAESERLERDLSLRSGWRGSN